MRSHSRVTATLLGAGLSLGALVLGTPASASDLAAPNGSSSTVAFASGTALESAPVPQEVGFGTLLAVASASGYVALMLRTRRGEE